jgi:uncharacterized lipoprotein YmbA
MKKLNLIIKSGLLMGSVLLCACSAQQPPKEIVKIQTVKVMEPFIPDPGAVEYIYEPPMVDVIDIPPGLDPEGIYYRPQHQQIVEIRQGRWNYYRKGQK